MTCTEPSASFWSCSGGDARLQPGTSDVLANPTIIVEVLSNSTEKYDRGLKWDTYQGIASLTDYLLASQVAPHIEHCCRDADTLFWRYRSARSGDRVTLRSAIDLDVDAIFDGLMSLPGD